MSKEDKNKVLARRNYFMSLVKKVEAQLKKDDALKKWSSIELDERIKQLQANFEKFDAKCTQLFCDHELTEEEKMQIESENDQMQTVFITTKSMMRKQFEHQIQCEMLAQEKKPIDTNESMSTGIMVSDTSDMVMRSTSVVNTWKIFTGNFDDWHVFEEKFKAIVDDKEKSDNEKLKLLQEACGGEAYEMLSALNTANFSKAWKKLREWYGSTYKQIQHAMKKVWNIKATKQASYAEIKQLITNANECVDIFKRVGRLNEFDTFVTFVIIKKMDPETTRFWERQKAALAESWASCCELDGVKRDQNDYVPDWDALKNFLIAELEFRSVSIYDEDVAGAMFVPTPETQTKKCVSEPDEKSKNATSESNQSDQMLEEKKRQPKFLQCNSCEGIHPLYKCEVFMGMDLQCRWKHVTDFGLCSRCLRPKHHEHCVDAKCNQRCPKCLAETVYHNSLLCPNSYNQP